MAKHRRIKVIGKQRKNVDAGLMAQIIIVLGKQMWAERQAERRRQRATRPARETKDQESS